MSRKRVHPRIDVELDVELYDAEGRVLEAKRIANLSLGGLFIEIDSPLEFGSEVEVHFALPGATTKLVCRGLVVRNEANAGVGVRFLSLGYGETRRLAAFVEDGLS